MCQIQSACFEPARSHL